VGQARSILHHSPTGSKVAIPDDPLYGEMFSEANKRIRESVTPIGFQTPDGTIHPFGTGTLLAVADTHFVISAAHVFLRILKGERPIFGFGILPTNDKFGNLPAALLEGQAVSFPDPVDVSVLRLDSPSVARLAGRRFLRLNDICLRPMSPGWAFVSGFPCERVQDVGEDTTSFTPLHLGAPITGLAPPDLPGFDPELHFVLNNNPADMNTTDGSPVSLPSSFGGISGSSVWQTWWPDDDESSRWRTRRVKIVGVQTGVYPLAKLIKASNWEGVLLAIYRSDPELFRSIRMHFPGLRLQ
jgi:hypothetical protein